MGSLFAGGGLFDAALRLAFDSSGNLFFVVDQGPTRRIVRFTPNGDGSLFATTTSQAFYVTIQHSVIPELGSMISITLGLAGPAGYAG